MSSDRDMPLNRMKLHGPLEPEDNERLRSIGMHTAPGTVVRLNSGGPLMTVSGIAKPTPERLDYALETVWINEAGEVKSLCAPFAVFTYG